MRVFLISLGKLHGHLMAEHQKWEAGPRSRRCKVFPVHPLDGSESKPGLYGREFLIFRATAQAANCRTGLLVESNRRGRFGYFFNIVFASASAEGSQTSVESSWWLLPALVLMEGCFLYKA